jgi:hypothetical protein
MPKKCVNPLEKKRTHSLPAEAIDKIYNFYTQWKPQLEELGIKNIPATIEFVFNMGVPRAVNLLNQVKNEAADTNHKSNTQPQK